MLKQSQAQTHRLRTLRLLSDEEVSRLDGTLLDRRGICHAVTITTDAHGRELLAEYCAAKRDPYRRTCTQHRGLYPAHLSHLNKPVAS